MATPRTPRPIDSEHRQMWMLGLGLAVLVIVGVSLYLHFKPKSTPRATSNLAAVAVTPGEYTDFYGQIDSIKDGVLTINFPISLTNGKQSTRVYHVTIGDQTVVTESIEAGEPTPIEPTVLKIDDMVQVFGDSNLAEVTSFTATRIVLVSQTSS